MPTKMTIEAAMIELNRLKTTERIRIARKPLQLLYCPKCTHGVSIFAEYCSTCGQALDWGGA